MLQMHEQAQTPWLDGALRVRPRRLAFGQTYEDAEIEIRSIPPQSRVVCIAGAGYTAHALANAGHRVTAVDINPEQVGYAQALTAGGPMRDGIAECLLRIGRHFAPVCGWTRRILDAFLSLSQCGEQVDYWDRVLDTPMWRHIFDVLLAPRLLGLCYRGPFVASLPSDFGSCVRERLRRGWALYPNRTNPYAALLLTGVPIVRPRMPQLPIRWVCADAAAFLEHSAPGSFDAFALSNIGDGASPAYRQRLGAAVEHAAAREAMVIWRSFGEPRSGLATNLAAMDRSLLWGVVSVSRLDALRSGGATCCIG